MFRCQHLTADNIRWRVNGTLIRGNPPPDITPGITRDEEGNLVYTLTIVAQVEYDRTMVECVARFDDGTPDEQSSSVSLLGKYLYMYVQCYPYISTKSYCIMCTSLIKVVASLN